MASRNTAIEAQELKIKFEQMVPSATIIIKKNQRGKYLVLEQRNCIDCDAVITTAAIGEISIDRCTKCAAIAWRVHHDELNKSVKEEAERIAELEWRNDFEEVQI